MDGAYRAQDYLKDPDAIYRASFAAIREEAELGKLPSSMQPLATRLIHACGMPDIIDDLAYTDDAAERGRDALNAGSAILTDATMVSAGITSRFLPKDNAIICRLNDERTPALAQNLNTTRSAAAVDLWRPHLEGAIVAIGNAPTALFRLLELIDEGAQHPAVILGFPVGFVGAEESKLALIEHPKAPPYIALRGRRGGSALAAAAVNALAMNRD